ncbi:MAG: hypothetical protein GY699_16060 [Desulfobacteraceae bacterium]|nr:hypothetical protein [Desulfobacteraceae bacterium]
MTSTLEASIRMGAMNDGMRNICELLKNIVMLNRPKMPTGLGQTGKRYGWSVPLSLHVIDYSSGGQTDANPLSVKRGTW